MFRYRLSTMLAAVAAAAGVVFLWLRYVSPNIAGLGVSNGMVVVRMTNEWAQRTYSNDSELSAVPASPNGGFPLAYDAYISFPLYVPAAAAAICVLVIGGVYLAARYLIRRAATSVR